MSRHPTVTPAGAEALRILAAQKGPITRSALAFELHKSRSNTSEIVDRLIASGHVREVPRYAARSGYAPLLALAAGVAAPDAPPPSPKTPRPVDGPPRAGNELPAPTLPALPRTIATLRGVKHPPIPQAYAPAPGESESRWVHLTTLKAPQYD